MIDSHCHLDDARFDACREQVLSRARAAGIDRFVVAGTASDAWPHQLELCRTHRDMHCAFGIHPWFCDRHQPQHLEQLESMLEHAVALGECGLDFMPGRPEQAMQLHWLDAQLALASRLQLPVILHCVRAAAPLMQALAPYPKLLGVVHGFTGSSEQAAVFVERGLYIGIGARVLREDAKRLARMAARLPLARLLLESDAPDGLPDGALNEPANLVRIAERVATLHGEPVETIIRAADLNAKELFRL